MALALFVSFYAHKMIRSEPETTYIVVPSHVTFAKQSWPDIAIGRPPIRLNQNSAGPELGSLSIIDGKYGNGLISIDTHYAHNISQRLSEYGNVGSSCGLPRGDTARFGLRAMMLEPYTGLRGKLYGASSTRSWRVVVTPENIPSCSNDVFVAIVHEGPLAEAAQSGFFEAFSFFGLNPEIIGSTPLAVSAGIVDWFGSVVQNTTWLQINCGSRGLGALYSMTAYAAFHARGLSRAIKSVHLAGDIESGVRLRCNWVRK